jgi:hypothetical protein
MVLYNTVGKGAELEDLKAGETTYKLVLLPRYVKDVKALKRFEPNLHEEVKKGIRQEIESGKLDEITGTGGWIKGRVASPSRNIGKSGGFRVIYLFFRIQQDVYLQTVYNHRSKADLSPQEKNLLKIMADAYKKAYEEKRGKS